MSINCDYQILRISSDMNVERKQWFQTPHCKCKKRTAKIKQSQFQYSDEKIKTVILTTYLTHLISNKRTESVSPNQDVWQWDTLYSQLSIHTFNTSCTRATI